MSDSYEFDLVQGLNKIYFSDCSKWPYVAYNSVVMLGPPLSSSATVGYLAMDKTSGYKDFSYYFNINDNLVLDQIFSGSNGVALFQLITILIPDNIYSN